MRSQNQSANISYLLSFLAILVHRAGGMLVIENLSSYANSDLELGMKIDVENDKVTLTATKKGNNILDAPTRLK